MGPQVALLVAALAGCLLPAGGCVICDQRVVAALDALEKEYLPTHMARERQGQVMETIRQTVRNFWDLPYLEDAFMGVIDEATMETSVLGFLRSMTLITNSDIADDTFVKEFSWMLTLEKAAFQRNVARFQREDFCPNKCVSSIQDVCNLDPAPSGMMLQPLIWCSNCKKQLHVCRKSTDCGVRQINIHEKEDLVLDCELNWHKLSQGLTYYSFYRGKQPTLTKPLVGPEDAGDYRCELGTVRSLPATVIHFEVTVLPQRIIEETPTSNFETEEQLSPTLQPSEYPKPEKVLRSLLVGLLIWGFVVLMIGFVTAVLCFLPGNVMDSIKSWLLTNKVAALQSQVPKVPKENDAAPSHK
ncbi:izumo sperm-egg fusion protein 1-like isoform X3 [Panthera tigris]|uniref:izumo sperm-egg fusion protein 1-like isoform X3 n=1 Tax=Panthera tigris TaxID=9694 RepID=UPI001C6F7B4C|nr:izumo sperm-egg fusion protein 1-like isoform X3 [Panthera tigris]